jgi:hypothetical protein
MKKTFIRALTSLFSEKSKETFPKSEEMQHKYMFVSLGAFFLCTAVYALFSKLTPSSTATKIMASASYKDKVS